VTDEQRSRRPIFIATLWVRRILSWLMPRSYFQIAWEVSWLRLGSFRMSCTLRTPQFQWRASGRQICLSQKKLDCGLRLNSNKGT